MPTGRATSDATAARILGCDCGQFNLGKSLGIDTVAQGVETEEQARFLSAQGCDFAQGFLYGKAMPAAAVPALIESCGAGAPVRSAAP